MGWGTRGIVAGAACAVLGVMGPALAHDPEGPRTVVGDDVAVVWTANVMLGTGSVEAGAPNAIEWWSPGDAGYFAEGPHRIEITRDGVTWVIGNDTSGCQDVAFRDGDWIIARALGPGAMVALGRNTGCP